MNVLRRDLASLVALDFFPGEVSVRSMWAPSAWRGLIRPPRFTGRVVY